MEKHSIPAAPVTISGSVFCIHRLSHGGDELHRFFHFILQQTFYYGTADNDCVSVRRCCHGRLWRTDTEANGLRRLGIVPGSAAHTANCTVINLFDTSYTVI